MKKGITRAVPPLLFLTLLLYTACSTVKEIVAFDYLYKLPRQTFSYNPALDKSSGQVIFSSQYTVNLDSILHANGLSNGVVGNTCFTECTVVIDQPDGGNFSWLKSVRIEVSGSAAFDSVVQVGYKTDIDPTSNTLSLTMTRANIRPYIGSNVFYYRVAGSVGLKSTSPLVQMHIDSKLLLRLQPLN